jgi:4-carboxymuconolactone decarboxylase
MSWRSASPARAVRCAGLSCRPCTARACCGAQYEWYAHARLALQCGVDAATVEAIRQGEAPKDLTPDQAAIYNFVIELNGTHGVRDETFQAVSSRFGTRGVMDLVGICGHYTMISMILNVAQVPTPDGSVPLKPLKHPK